MHLVTATLLTAEALHDVTSARPNREERVGREEEVRVAGGSRAHRVVASRVFGLQIRLELETCECSVER